MDASERRGASAEHGAARAWAGAGREAAAPRGAAGARCAACAGSGPGGTELHSPESDGKKANRYPGNAGMRSAGVGSGEPGAARARWLRGSAVTGRVQVR